MQLQESFGINMGGAGQKSSLQHGTVGGLGWQCDFKQMQFLFFVCEMF